MTNTAQHTPLIAIFLNGEFKRFAASKTNHKAIHEMRDELRRNGYDGDCFKIEALNIHDVPKTAAERDRLKIELANCKALKRGLAHDSAKFMCNLQDQKAELLEIIKLGLSVQVLEDHIDWCGKARAAIAKAKGAA